MMAFLVAVRKTLSRALALWQATLREIFDESAYERYLARHQVSSSRSAYSEFLREQAQIAQRLHRCC